MARLKCKCGEIMWNGNVPNDIELWVYTDKKLECILEKDDISSFELPDLFEYNVWRCPKCKRLYVFDEQEDTNHAKYVYKLEKED